MWIDKQKTINLQLEMPVRLSTYRKGNAIPPLPGTNIFHSTELFHVFEMIAGGTSAGVSRNNPRSRMLSPHLAGRTHLPGRAERPCTDSKRK